MWESQKKSKLGRCLLKTKWLYTNKQKEINQTTTKKGMQQTEQKATNASPSLKLSSIKKKNYSRLPPLRLYLPCKILATVRHLSPHTNIQVARF